MGQADLLYEQISSIQKIDEFISDFENEQLHLDFKGRVNDPFAGGWDHIRTHLGKALSGFANADGGVLVLGIGESKDGNPRPKEPYSEALRLSQKILEQVSRLTDPPVAGVQTKVIASVDTLGFVIILIPKSEIAPHQVVHDKKYYQRAGESHTPMAHFQIADLFGRRPQPNLFAEAQFINDMSQSDSIVLQIHLANQGAGIAKYPFIAFHNFGVFRKRPHFTPWLPDQLNMRRQTGVYAGGVDKVVHSGTSVPILQVMIAAAVVGADSITKANLQIFGETGCEGMATKKFLLEIPKETLVKYREERTFSPEPIFSHDA